MDSNKKQATEICPAEHTSAQKTTSRGILKKTKPPFPPINPRKKKTVLPPSLPLTKVHSLPLTKVPSGLSAGSYGSYVTRRGLTQRKRGLMSLFPRKSYSKDDGSEEQRVYVELNKVLEKVQNAQNQSSENKTPNAERMGPALKSNAPKEPSLNNDKNKSITEPLKLSADKTERVASENFQGFKNKSEGKEKETAEGVGQVSHEQNPRDTLNHDKNISTGTPVKLPAGKTQPTIFAETRGYKRATKEKPIANEKGQAPQEQSPRDNVRGTDLENDAFSALFIPSDDESTEGPQETNVPLTHACTSSLSLSGESITDAYDTDAYDTCEDDYTDDETDSVFTNLSDTDNSKTYSDTERSGTDQSTSEDETDNGSDNSRSESGTNNTDLSRIVYETDSSGSTSSYTSYPRRKYKNRTAKRRSGQCLSRRLGGRRCSQSGSSNCRRKAIRSQRRRTSENHSSSNEECGSNQKEEHLNRQRQNAEKTTAGARSNLIGFFEKGDVSGSGSSTVRETFIPKEIDDAKRGQRYRKRTIRANSGRRRTKDDAEQDASPFLASDWTPFENGSEWQTFESIVDFNLTNNARDYRDKKLPRATPKCNTENRRKLPNPKKTQRRPAACSPQLAQHVRTNVTQLLSF